MVRTCDDPQRRANCATDDHWRESAARPIARGHQLDVQKEWERVSVVAKVVAEALIMYLRYSSNNHHVASG